jgi:hypothetical protein
VNRHPYLFANSFCRILKSATLIGTLLVAVAPAQNPVPQIIGPVHPMTVAPASGAFTLNVYGANFVPGAVVNWNRQPRVTTFVSGHELQAQIPSTDIAKNTAGLISVTNPGPGGGNSSASWAQVEVHVPLTTISISKRKQYPIGDWLLMAADFNNDGILDVVGEYGPYLEYYAGEGNGAFHFGSVAGRGYPGIWPGSYGDFNGDGNLDLVFPQGNNINPIPTQMAVMLGDGKGKFRFGSQFTDSDGFEVLAVGDFNSDGKLDLIVRGKFNFSLFLGNGDGTFRHVRNYPNAFLAGQIVVGDFNNDGKLDLLLFESPIYGTNSGIALYTFLGNGDGSFQAPQQIASFPTARGCSANGTQGTVQVTDFNGDGKLDLAFCDQNQIGILLGNGDGTFQPPVFYTAGTNQAFAFAIGDLNSDGKPDLLVSRYDNVNDTQFEVFLGNGDGTFQGPQTTHQVSAYFGFVMGDYNSDGVLDFLAPSGLGLQAYIQ